MYKNQTDIFLPACTKSASPKAISHLMLFAFMDLFCMHETVLGNMPWEAVLIFYKNN